MTSVGKLCVQKKMISSIFILYSFFYSPTVFGTKNFEHHSVSTKLIFFFTQRKYCTVFLALYAFTESGIIKGKVRKYILLAMS